MQLEYPQHWLAIALLAILLPATHRAGGPRQSTRLELLFIMLILSAMVALITELAGFACEGLEGVLMRNLNMATACVTFIVCPGPACFLCLYVAEYLGKSRGHFKAVIAFPAALFTVNAVFACTSPWTGFYFGVDSANHFSTGSFWPLSVLLAFLPLGMTVFIIAINRHHADRRIMLILFASTALIAVATIVQIGTGAVIIFPAVALGALIIFIYINLNLIEIDFLTGLNNRLSLITFSRRLDQFADRDAVACIVADLNHFKKINDTYGHAAGDQALVDFAAILRTVFRRSDFIARLGGDEFAILLRLKGAEEGKAAMERLRQGLEDFNARKSRQWSLSASLGLCVRSVGERLSVDTLLQQADRRMYQDKRTALEHRGVRDEGVTP